MLPFEFIVTGTPVSVQARNRKRLGAWKARVKASASAWWPPQDAPEECDLKVTIVFYFDAVTLDTDNIIKPILDSLKGVVYEDDSKVTDVSSSRRDLNKSFTVKGMSPILAQGFISDEDFVHIRIEVAPDPQELI